MVCTPAVVCTIIGNTDEMKIRKIGEASPTPNHRIAIGIQAIGEIGRSIWKSGLSVVNAPRTQPIQSPSGTATSDRQRETRADAKQRRADVLPQRAVRASARPCRSRPATASERSRCRVATTTSHHDADQQQRSRVRDGKSLLEPFACLCLLIVPRFAQQLTHAPAEPGPRRRRVGSTMIVICPLACAVQAN